MLQSSSATTSLAARQCIRVLAVLEATRVTGVARNVVEYARLARSEAGGVPVSVTAVLVRRGAGPEWRADVLRDHAVAAGVPVDTLAERRRYDQQAVRALRSLIDAHDPHLIETHHIKSHCFVALSGAWRERPWVAFHHGYTQTDLKVRAYNQVDRWSLRRAAHVVTTNEPFAAALGRRGVHPGRITVLHNGVRPAYADPSAVALLRRSLGLTDRERVVLAVGRLSREKGQAYLVRAAAAWQGRARLVIVGDGPDRPMLERLARCSPPGQVIFVGMSSNVAPFYRMADVFVLPSLSEGSPNVLLEAMACGLPIAATRVGGVPEIATHQVSALLGPPRDPEFLGDAVNTLLDNPVLCTRLGAAARETALNRHTPEQRAATLSRLYSTLLGHGHRPNTPPLD